jgi:hypothetical protein
MQVEEIKRWTLTFFYVQVDHRRKRTVICLTKLSYF